MAWSTLTLVLIPTPVSYTHLDVYKRQEYKYDQDMSTQYDHKQDILAAYLGYQMKYKKLGGKAGIRYEHTFMAVSYTHLKDVSAIRLPVLRYRCGNLVK